MSYGLQSNNRLRIQTTELSEVLEIMLNKVSGLEDRVQRIIEEVGLEIEERETRLLAENIESRVAAVEAIRTVMM